MTAQVQPATTRVAPPKAEGRTYGIKWTERTWFLYDGKSWCLTREGVADMGLPTIEQATAYTLGRMRVELKDDPNGDKLVMKLWGDMDWIHQLAHQTEQKVKGARHDSAS